MKLNKSALVATVAQLAKAGDDLTPLQREQARQHLLKHYEELELEPPESLSGEMVRVTATVCGEMSVSEIPPCRQPWTWKLSKRAMRIHWRSS